jgi:hypothetical protein
LREWHGHSGQRTVRQIRQSTPKVQSSEISRSFLHHGFGWTHHKFWRVWRIVFSLPAVAHGLRLLFFGIGVFRGFVAKPLRVLFYYCQICLAKPAEIFAQFFLTKSESVEQDVFSRHSFLPLSERQ